MQVTFWRSTWNPVQSREKKNKKKTGLITNYCLIIQSFIIFLQLLCLRFSCESKYFNPVYVFKPVYFFQTTLTLPKFFFFTKQKRYFPFLGVYSCSLKKWGLGFWKLKRIWLENNSNMSLFLFQPLYSYLFPYIPPCLPGTLPTKSHAHHHVNIRPEKKIQACAGLTTDNRNFICDLWNTIPQICFIKMVNLIISHQIFPSLLLGFVQKIEETIQQKQPADECWLLNSIHHGLCLHVQCFHTVWNFMLCRRHCLLLGPCFCQSWTVFSVLKQHRFMTQWLWNQYTLPYIISRLILLKYVDTYLSHRWLTGAYWGHHDNLNQSHFEII